MLGEDAIETAWIIAWTAFIYYDERPINTATADESPLTDQEYDALSRIVAQDWGELTGEQQTFLGSPDEILASGCHIKLTSSQAKEAKRVTDAAMKRLGR